MPGVNLSKHRQLKPLKCPSCDGEIKIKGQVRLGLIITCRYCKEKTEVVSLNPVLLESVDSDEKAVQGISD